MRKPEANGEAIRAARWLQRAVPTGKVDIDGPDLDAVLPGVAHHLRRRVEAHRLRVQERAAEHVGMVAFHPGRGIGDQGEGGGMAFGKAVGAEAFELLEGALGELLRRSRARACPG